MEIYTIGHSNQSLESFISKLQQEGIEYLADVRTGPGSWKFPWFGKENLEEKLAEVGIEYHWFKNLGGFKDEFYKREVSLNSGWDNDGFRNYADYMIQPEYDGYLQELIDVASLKKVAYMCAESLWWRCHRRLISDALVLRGHKVFHILGRKPSEHKITKFAKIAALEGKQYLLYPPKAG